MAVVESWWAWRSHRQWAADNTGMGTESRIRLSRGSREDKRLRLSLRGEGYDRLCTFFSLLFVLPFLDEGMVLLTKMVDIEFCFVYEKARESKDQFWTKLSWKVWSLS